MKRFICLFIMCLTVLSCLTGCLKRNKMEDIRIITTIYPIEYVTDRLYGDKSEVSSIYPRGAVSSKYSITGKQLNDYSQYDMFIYNGREGREREYATKMLNNNKNLKIIDASYGIGSVYSTSDIWLNPSNILMLGQNIKNQLSEYVSAKNLIKDINTNYSLLKENITELETEIKKTADNSINNTIVSYNESLNFLEKYGFNVINLTYKGKNKERNIETARELISSGKISYIFVMENFEENDLVKDFLNNYSVDTLIFRDIDTINEKDVENKDDYLSIMYDNVELLKDETYK